MSIIELQYFERNDIEQLINWIPSAEFLLQWGGPVFYISFNKRTICIRDRMENERES